MSSLPSGAPGGGPSIPRLLRIHGIHPSKSRGQNFLVDDAIATRIVTGSGVSAGDPVVEIGPGLGSLTIPLLTRVERVWAVEQDRALIPLLRERCAPHGTLEVINGDALTWDFQSLAERLGGKLRVVANLPYSIGTGVLLHLLEQRAALADLTLMFQKEVADRLVAPINTKEYGTLSVYCQLWTRMERLFEVPPSAFHPRPQVTSTVVRFVVLEQPVAAVADEALLRKVVRAAFGWRRKTLRNALSNLDPAAGEWLHAAEIHPERRAETLTVEEFVRLANVVAAMQLKV